MTVVRDWVKLSFPTRMNFSWWLPQGTPEADYLIGEEVLHLRELTISRPPFRQLNCELFEPTSQYLACSQLPSSFSFPGSKFWRIILLPCWLYNLVSMFATHSCGLPSNMLVCRALILPLPERYLSINFLISQAKHWRNVEIMKFQSIN